MEREKNWQYKPEDENNPETLAVNLQAAETIWDHVVKPVTGETTAEYLARYDQARAPHVRELEYWRARVAGHSHEVAQEEADAAVEEHRDDPPPY